MKNRNKIFCRLILVFTLIISVLTSNVYAVPLQTVEQDQKILYQETIHVSTDTNKQLNNKNYSLSKRDAKGINEVLSVLNKADNQIIKNDLSTTPTPFSYNINTPSSMLGSSTIEGVNSVTIHHTLYSNNIKRTISDEFTIENITGIVPTSLGVSQFLQNSDISNPIMGNWYHDNIFDNLGVSWTGSEIYVGNSKKEEVPAETKYWGYFGSANAYYSTGFMEGISASVNWKSPFYLVNSTGNQFPDYQDTWSGKKASDPLYTKWSKTPTPVDWNKNIRGQKIKEYIDTYGDPKLDWSKYDLHHIQPRAYGGTNDLSNLIAIPRTNHNAISGWFNGYSTNSINSDPLEE